MLASVFLIALQAAPDPWNLPIGRPGTVTVQPGELWDLRAGKKTSMDQMIAAAAKRRYVFFGESHATLPHQEMEADIITSLHTAGKKVIVGLEMLTRPTQPVLDRWVSGELDEATFIQDVDWKGQWGFDFDAYRPVFLACQKDKIPMVALNVPRDWVRRVGRSGFAGLTADEKLQLPSTMNLTQAGHRKVFNALMGGHPVSGARGENMYAAQVLWDEGMAHSAITAMQPHQNDPNVVMVVLSGSGHMAYGQGINLRIAMHAGERGLNIAALGVKGTKKVSRGLADFLYVSKD
ncbi:MAG: ChaN family lipoprotein [Fimbriimonadaceae bacterium]|nr:ChaN family lipoprotein [Fimbriimonadaceae bacterium]